MAHSLFQGCKVEVVTFSVMDTKSNVTNHAVLWEDNDFILQNFIAASMLIIPYISTLTGSVVNYTNIEDDIRQTTLFIANHREMLFNGTNTELEIVENSIARLSEFISQYNFVVNATYVDNVMTSFDRMVAFVSNHTYMYPLDSSLSQVNISHFKWAVPVSVCGGLYVYANTWYKCTTSIITGTVCFIGVLGNALAFYVFGKMGHKNVSTVLLKALAITDSALLLFAIFHISRCELYFGCFNVSNM